MGKNNNSKHVADQPQEDVNVLNQEQERQPQPEAKSETNETIERLLKEKTEEAKLKFSAKVNLLVSDKELQETTTVRPCTGHASIPSAGSISSVSWLSSPSTRTTPSPPR